MLVLIYLGLAVYLGDHVCRRFYRFISVPHRWAAAALVGLLFSSWFTYLTALTFARASKPLLWADLVFFAAGAAAIFVLHLRSRRGLRQDAGFIEPRAPGSERWDWVTLGIYLVIACWMMFATLNVKGNTLQIGNNEWSDFGPNTAIAQNFVFGHNFPTQYPHFAGPPIRYHFLFYFQAANLEFLGLNLARSFNLLSILSLVCMLALVMALGQVLFSSRTVGRIASTLFFFHGTLSFIPFLRSQSSVAAALHSIFSLKDFLPSGYPYRGELWGIWTQVVFLNQRHFASGIGILLIVLIFLIGRYRQKLPSLAIKPSADEDTALWQRTIASSIGAEISTLPADDKPMQSQEPDATPIGETQPAVNFATKVIKVIKETAVSDRSFVFSGFLLGALPFWNALVFTAAFAVLLCLFVLFPYRRYMVGLGITAAVVAFPQIHFLRSGALPTAPSLFHWGYVIEQPTIAKVIKYLGFTFGVKWLLIALALIFVSWFHRRLFIAICILFPLTFFTQLSAELLANHKFLNIWLILSNLFVAYALWALWNTKIKGLVVTGRMSAVVLAIPIFTGGIIDLFPIHNSHWVEMSYRNDPLVEWVRSQTKPHDVFLTDRFANHQILLAGRRIFYGTPSYAWGAGYDTTKRDGVYRQLFESKDPRLVFNLLKDNRIAYVAFDNGVRHGEFIKHPNEQIYANNFQKVFEDKANKYGSLIIYKVPEAAPAHFKSVDLGESAIPEAPAVSMFQGGKGMGRGQFDFPRGMAVDGSGNILVSDTNNGRIQKFSPAGVFLSSIGKMGGDEGELKEANGIAVDKSGNIYVADVTNQRVQKLKPDGTFIAQWKGPAPGFYGPRDISIGPDDSIYVVDQGRERIVKFNPDGEVLAVWGSGGKGDGQFANPTAVAIDAKNNRVYVADPRNKRIQVFDANGKFVAKWPVEEWQQNAWAFQDLIIDSKAERLYASSLTTEEVLVFDLAGTKIGVLKPKPPDKLEGASALALRDGKLYVLCTFSNRVRQIDLETK
jgi:DNA-binding beta-propeller fold protein YncE